MRAFSRPQSATAVLRPPRTYILYILDCKALFSSLFPCCQTRQIGPSKKRETKKGERGGEQNATTEQSRRRPTDRGRRGAATAQHVWPHTDTDGAATRAHTRHPVAGDAVDARVRCICGRWGTGHRDAHCPVARSFPVGARLLSQAAAPAVSQGVVRLVYEAEEPKLVVPLPKKGISVFPLRNNRPVRAAAISPARTVLTVWAPASARQPFA